MTIKLNGEDYLLGSGRRVITEGLDMKCKPVIATGTLERGAHNEIICRTEGIKVLIHDVKGFYIDTPANRKLLKSTFK